jgi:uncharacterized iron-regulated protein
MRAMSLRAFFSALLVLGSSCTGPHSSAREQQPMQEPASRMGRIWDVRGQRWVDEAALRQELAGARYVLLGERHDNPHHHALQAALVRALAAAGRKPVVAMEMLDLEQQPQVDAALVQAPQDPDAFARAVEWESRGWDWALYRPVVAAALEAGLPLVAVNLSRTEAQRLARGGAASLRPEERARLGLDVPLPEAEAAELRAELQASHCGQLPENALEGMMLAQRARDAVMARRLVETDRGDGAILITGAGHARKDRGVATVLARLAPERTVRSVAFVEVSPAGEAQGLSPEEAPYDFLWFTPAVEREDPCAAFRRGGSSG